MDGEAAPAIKRARRPWHVALLRFALGTLVACVVAVLSALWAIDTDPGHRFLADRIGAARPASGLRVHIGRIEGSIWHRLRLRDLRLSDPRGVFLEAPSVSLDWRPTDRLFNRLTIEALTADLVRLDRLPVLRPVARQGPLLPSFDVRIGRLAVRRLVVGAAVSGRPRIARLDGRADIRQGRAFVHLDAAAGAGDRVTLLLDAEPARDRFDVDITARSPANGVLGAVVGTRRPLALDVHGDGRWARWTGRARLDLAARPIVDLGLSAAGGRYRLAGSLAPSAVLQGKLQRLSAPLVRVGGEAGFADRRLTGTLSLRSAALAIRTAGTIDLATSRFADVRLDARLLRPPALFPNMTGQDIRLRVDLDGPFRTAAFQYLLTAPRLAFDDTGFEAVRAAGRGRWSAAPVRVPLHLTARRVTGVGDVAGGILGGLAVDGTLDVTKALLTGNHLRLASDKLRGDLGLRVDLVSGRYDVALTGALARYFIPGIGIVDVSSTVSVVPGPGDRGTVVSGRGQAIVRRFDNAFLRSLAGGLPCIDTGLVRTPDGVIHFNGLRLTGPSIALTGNGYRRRDGSFHFEGSGTQGRYGPVVLLLDGQIDHPHVELHLARPADALALAGVDAVIDPIEGGFTWRATGGSALGRFSGNGRILTPATAPAVVEVAALDVSGTRARGALRSDPAGFTGRLAIGGGGLGGTIDFLPAGEIQRIDLHLTAQDARIAGPAALAVRRGRLDGTVLLDPVATGIDGRVVAVGLRRGPVSLARIDATAHLRGGTGDVRAALAGSRGRAFTLDTALRFAPSTVMITAGGQVDRQAIALEAPAVVRFAGDGWQLAPATLRYGGGTATVSAANGAGGIALDAALAAMPLTVLDLGFPQLGLGGSATGKLSWRSGAGLPVARANLTVRGLTRAGLVLSSTPVDLGLAAVLDGGGAGLRAVAQSGGRTIGRAQARLAPLSPGSDPLARLLTAPLTAQLRYGGPADVLWRLTGIETIDLSGPVSIAADIGGRLADPVIRGSVRSDRARLESAVTGTVIDNARFAGRFDGSRLLVDSFAGQAGSGTVSGDGRFDLAAASGFGFDLSIDATNALLLNADDIGATVTGPLTIRSSGGNGVISGDVRLTRSRFQLGRAATAASVPRLAVREVNRPDDLAEPDAAPASWRLDLKADARNRLAVSGLGLDSEWRARLAIAGTTDAPRITGEAELIRGGYQFAGRRFDLERGIIRFTGESPPDPALDITAEAGITGLNATIRVTGTGQKPEIAFTSVPSLPEDELLSRLLFGTSIQNLSAPEALQLAAAVNGLRTGGGGLDPINAVRRAAGLDRLRILPADVATGQRTTVAAGKYVTRRVYVEVATDGQGYSATRVEWELTRWLSLLSSISTLGRTSANVRISKDY